MSSQDTLIDNTADILSHIAYVAIKFYGKYVPEKVLDEVTSHLTQYSQEPTEVTDISTFYHTFCYLLNERLTA
jgi:hypothetical protein